MNLDDDDKEFFQLTVENAISNAYENQHQRCQEGFDDRYIKKNGKKPVVEEKHEHDENEIVISLPKKIVTNPFIYIILLSLAIIFLFFMAITGVNPLG